MNTGKTPSISVIIPVFNKEEYLAECLDSVINQTLQNIEIICINDGSTDGSLKILEEYQQKDERIKVLDRQNMGAAHARNNAMKAANGEYIAFMDADDYYPENDVLESLYFAAVNQEANIALGSLVKMREDGKIKTGAGLYSDFWFNEDKKMHYQEYQFCFGFTRGIYMRDMLRDNNIEFPLYENQEDPVFFCKTMICAGEFYSLAKVVYVYRDIKKPIDTWTEQKVIDSVLGLKDMLVLSKKHSLAKLHFLAFQHLNDLRLFITIWLEKRSKRLVLLLAEVNNIIDTSLLLDAKEFVDENSWKKLMDGFSPESTVLVSALLKHSKDNKKSSVPVVSLAPSPKKRFITAAILLMFVFFFYTTNTLIQNCTYGIYTDFPIHIDQALHYRHFSEMDFQTFVETAPMQHNIVQPGWHISFLPFYLAWNSLGLDQADSARLSASIVNAIFNILAIAAISIVFIKYLEMEHKRFFAPVLAVVMLFAGPLYMPVINESYYLGQLYSGVWHNPTNQPLKFFIAVTFFPFIHMSNNRERLVQETLSRLPFKISKFSCHLVLLALLLLLSALFNPAHVLVFIPALFIYCCMDLITTRGKSIAFCIKIGLSVLPVGVLLLLQSTLLTGLGGGEISISQMTVWNHWSPHPILSLLISLPFPIFAICIGYRRLHKDKMMILTLLIMLIALLQFIFFVIDYEHSIVAGDFAWSMQVSTLLFFVTSYIFFNQKITKHTKKAIKRRVITTVGHAILFAQFLFGGIYYIMLVRGTTETGGGLFG